MLRKIIRHSLEFKRPSGTSRGILKTKDSWFLTLINNHELVGVGEVSLIEKLSPENPQLMNKILEEITQKPELPPPTSISQNLPAVRFALEMFQEGHISNCPYSHFHNSFTQGETGIPINGLIWMGNKKFMFEQIKRKIEEGYSCIKLKIGAIDFEEEIDLLSYVRRQYGSDDISLRVDANGAFSGTSVMEKLKRLSDLEIHSIEQPIKQGQLDKMAHLCATSPIDIALDEELIGVTSKEEKQSLLIKIQPQYIILKPSLLGGWRASEEWIDIANKYNVGWWVTSALESNVGLNAIAQWVGSFSINRPQGLGTGGLYTNNIDSPLYIKNAKLWYNPQKQWDKSFFKNVS